MRSRKFSQIKVPATTAGDNSNFDKSLEALLQNPSAPIPLNDFFFISVEGRFIKIRWSEVKYLKAELCYVIIQTATVKHMIYYPLVGVEEMLPAGLFCRIHRAWIIPIAGITEVKREWIYVDGQPYPLSRFYRKKVLAMLYPFVLNKTALQ